MNSPTAGGWRVLRATTLGVSSALISVTGHLLGSIGEGIAHLDFVAIGFIALLCTLVAAFLAESEFTTKRLVTFVVSTQLLAHIPLSYRAGQEHGTHNQVTPGSLVDVAPALSVGHGSTAGSTHHFDHGSSVADFMGSLAAGLTSTATLSMLFAHIVAGALIVILLRDGEALLFRMHQQIPEFVKVLLGYANPNQPIRLPILSIAGSTPEDRTKPLALKLFHSTTDPQRGPPAFCA